MSNTDIDYRRSWESYAAIWKLEGAKAKTEACRSILDEAVVYTDPLTQRRGWSELATYMAEFHEQVPGGHFVTKEFWAHHGRSVARWDMVGGDGTVLGHGVSYAEYRNDGKLTSMTGFFTVDG